jgi:hypothetical protein
MKYAFANTTAQREQKLNPHANNPASVKMTEINHKYEVNPFIYAFMDSQFRDDTKAMFKRLCPCL